jgi:hypothetical protein
LSAEIKTFLKEENMPQKTIGFILMLDNSSSMSSVIQMTKIYSKAFLRQAQANDQFGVNQFKTEASWVYPTGTSPNIVTVSSSLAETGTAADAIERLTASGVTNMGGAITLGNNMIPQAATDLKAFVMLSDGDWNEGTDPSRILGATPPIYIAGFGPWLNKDKFKPLLAKNPNSKYYYDLNAYKVMQIYNDISQAADGIDLTANKLDTYSGSDYTITDSIISHDSEEARFTVVWSDKRFVYTSGNPSGYNVNVVLIDPHGDTSKEKPIIADPGYCIFNLSNAEPGTWRTLVQYSVPQQVYGTSAGFQFDTTVGLQVDAPALHSAGKPLRFNAKVLDEGQPVEGLTINCHITHPQTSFEEVIKQHSKDLKSVKPDEKHIEKGMPEDMAKLVTLRASKMKDGDILAHTHTMSHGVMKPGSDGTHQFEIPDTKVAGSYSVELHVTGKNRKTGKSFTRTKRFSTLVG